MLRATGFQPYQGRGCLTSVIEKKKLTKQAREEKAEHVEEMVAIKALGKEKHIKETLGPWQLSAMWDSGLDPQTEK